MPDRSDTAAFDVAVDAARTVAARRFAASDHRLHATLVLGHGAGAGQKSVFMVSFAAALSVRGVDVVTFDFPYMQAHKRVPDPNGVLEATWSAVIGATVRLEGLQGNALFIGGKSMGGRIASQVAAQKELLASALRGLVFLGYPLHPPGQPDRRRDAHLPRVDAPMLFVQGERDTFGNAEEMRALVARLPHATLHVVEGANHSLDPPKRAGTNREAVYSEVQDLVAGWVRERA